MKKRLRGKPHRKSRDQREILSSGRIPLKDWDKVRAQLIANIRRSERLTAADFNITINCRD